MKSIKCQSCGFISANSTNCKKCGAPIMVVKHKSQPMEQSSLIWCDNDKLVMDLRAFLPDRCIVCNASSEGKYFPLTLSYNHKLLKAPLAVGVAAISYKEVKLPVGLCATHLSRQRYNVFFGIALIVVGLVIMLAAIFGFTSASNIVVPIVAMLGGVLISGLGAMLMSHTPLQIEDAKGTNFWIKGVSSDYLASFPRWTS